jgi:zinc D-Ala-D-Ala dipeptidase
MFLVAHKNILLQSISNFEINPLTSGYLHMKKSILFIFTIALIACRNSDIREEKGNTKPEQLEVIGETAEKNDHFKPYNAYEQTLIESGLIDIGNLDSNIIVDLRYATANNFTGQVIYSDLTKAFLQADVAEKLKKAAAYLNQKKPGFKLLVYDAARPFSAQQFMWDVTQMPIEEKTKYLSNPKAGSVHNYGAAVDLSIVDEKAEVLDMGTEYDFFGDLAQPVKEAELLRLGKLTETQVTNRKLLREVMKYGGFYNLPTEWWHFNACNREEAKARYVVIR